MPIQQAFLLLCPSLYPILLLAICITLGCALIHAYRLLGYMVFSMPFICYWKYLSYHLCGFLELYPKPIRYFLAFKFVRPKCTTVAQPKFTTVAQSFVLSDFPSLVPSGNPSRTIWQSMQSSQSPSLSGLLDDTGE